MIMKKLNFEKGDGLIPAVVQDSVTRKVLMLGYMNREALDKTKETGQVTFYSRSKGRLWTKGESSGNILEYLEARVDCDGDALLIYARPTGPVCHTGTDTCWTESNASGLPFLSHLEDIIARRKAELENPDQDSGSYVASLLGKGIQKVAQKVGEEAVETVIEALGEDRELFLNENADLLFHQLVLLQAKGYRLSDVIRVLESRHQAPR
jgi:phosphoribosyl-ATP pyrophosphohydrolase/phosphoribosyl-AMP cyclohydrolase